MSKRKTVITDPRSKKLKIIECISVAVDRIVFTASILLLLIGLYAFYDTHNVYELADSETYAQYKPSSDDRLSYNELRKINGEVIGWLDVYGTKIDYPVLQSADNDKYLDRTVTGEYSTAGSVFLDYRNNKNFIDFNNIIYGHHMDQRKMFGDIDKFTKRKFFDTHHYGVLHRNKGRSLGIEFFSIIKTEGTDARIFTAAVTDDISKKLLIDYLYDKAIQSRQVEINKNDRIVLLSTCTFSITNGRHILAGKLSNKVHKDTFPKANDNNRNAKWIYKITGFSLLLWLLLLLLVLIIVYCLYERRKHKCKQMMREKNKCQTQREL